MTYSKINYIATAGQTEFEITFDFISWKHIVVKVDGVVQESLSNYNVVGGNVVFNTPLEEGDVVIISRATTVDTDSKPYELKGRLTKEKLDKAFKHITYPVEELAEYIFESTGALSPNLENMADFNIGRANIGVSSKGQIDTLLVDLLNASNNLDDLTDFATARDNINTYSKSEALALAEEAKAILDNFEIEGISLGVGRFSPCIQNITLDIYADGVYRINQNGGSYIWINDGLYLFNYIQGTLTDMQWGQYYYVFARVDEDGGFYTYTKTTAPTEIYRGNRGEWSSGEFNIAVGYLFGYGSLFYGRQTYHNPIVWNKNEKLWFQAWQEQFIP